MKKDLNRCGGQSGSSPESPRASSAPVQRVRSLSALNGSPGPASFKSTAPFSLRNVHGFWQLTFHGHDAVPPQDQGFFYLAYLFARPFEEPLPGNQFAAEVYKHYSPHSDFRHGMHWLDRRFDDCDVVDILRKKQKSLEAILDASDEIEPVKAEALRELSLLYELEKTYVAQVIDTAQTTSQIITKGLQNLQASLARTVDGHGDPHPVLRPFARHILLYVIMPSIRSTGASPIHRFTYEPQLLVNWEISIKNCF